MAAASIAQAMTSTAAAAALGVSEEGATSEERVALSLGSEAKKAYLAAVGFSLPTRGWRKRKPAACGFERNDERLRYLAC